MLYDFDTDDFPDWFKFVGDATDKFIPPNVRAIMVAAEAAEALIKNKEKIKELGTKYIDVKLEEATRALDEESKSLHAGGFTYEDCVF